MLIFVASTGRSLAVEVGANARISTIMETLLGATNIPLNEQILMCDGVRLDATKLLSNYSLPETLQTGTRDVFLYNKSHLRIQGTHPPEEAIKDLEQTSLEDEEEESYHKSEPPQGASPMQRLLYQYNDDFRSHLKEARRIAKLAKGYHEHSLELISEMEVQSKAIDSARTSVESYYNYIHTQLSMFNKQFGHQRKAHKLFLDGFDAELSKMASVRLHPRLQRDEQTMLIDLIDAAKLKSWATECRAFHQNLTQKVATLDNLFEALKGEVEAVFMEAPSVNLEALAIRSDTTAHSLDEMESMVQVLENDCNRIGRILKSDTVHATTEGRGELPTAMDNCSLMETVHENHSNHLMPKLQQTLEGFREFYHQSVADKNQMIKDVVSQLRRISSQQTHIQGMRNKLSAFKEASLKESDMIRQLMIVRQTSIAYRQCLAECMRRQAFGELYANQAEQMAERMGKLREKEQARRDSFRQQVSTVMPAALLSALGLMESPQHCQVSLPAASGDLASVSLQELQAASSQVNQSNSPVSPAQHLTKPSAEKAQELDEEGSPEGSTGGVLAVELENARLKLEIAQLHSELGRLELNAGAISPNVEAPALKADPAKTETKRWRAALAAQQSMVSRLEQDLASTKLQSSAYANRIVKLEHDLQNCALASQVIRPVSDSSLPGEVSSKALEGATAGELSIQSASRDTHDDQTLGLAENVSLTSLVTYHHEDSKRQD